MKTRADFLRAQKGRRASAPGLGLETCDSPRRVRKTGAARLGITASRKVGGAVERNRAKRRLGEAARAVLPLLGREGRDYVLIARIATLSRPFAELVGDLTRALAAAHAALDREHRAGERTGSARGALAGKDERDD
jgi:ribonuclease P protein component